MTDRLKDLREEALKALKREVFKELNKKFFGEIFTDKDVINATINHLAAQGHLTPPIVDAKRINALKNAKNDFQMAIDHWADGENFVCMAETTQVIKGLLENALSPKAALSADEPASDEMPKPVKYTDGSNSREYEDHGSDGFVLVPREPTRKMYDAGAAAMHAEKDRLKETWGKTTDQYADTLSILAYRAMIASAPNPAQEKE